MYHQGPPLHYFGILDMHFLGLEFEAYVLISMSEISRETLDGDSESERRPQICMVWYGTEAHKRFFEGGARTFQTGDFQSPYLHLFEYPIPKYYVNIKPCTLHSPEMSVKDFLHEEHFLKPPYAEQEWFLGIKSIFV